MSPASTLRSSASALDLAAYRRDLWPRDTLATRQGDPPPSPAQVVWPKDRQQVRQALDLAAQQDLAVVPYGAGSGVCGGAAGTKGALVVDLKGMTAIRQLDPQARTVRVQPGVLGQHLEDWLGRRGWMTAHSPSSIWCSTVGGYVAARSAGQFSSRYGVFDDMLLAADAEAPAGRMLTGAWTPTGEDDLLPVLSGSEGGLAIVTDTLLRIAPLPEQRWLRGYAFANLPSAWTAMRRLMQAGLWPSVLRLYDPMDTRLNRTTRGGRRSSPTREPADVLQTLRDTLGLDPRFSRRLVDLPLALPGLVNRIAGGLGKEVALIVGFEGPAAVVDAQVALAQRILAAGRDLGAGPGERWFGHRHAVSYKLAPIFAAGAFADTMEVAATWSRLEALHDGVRAAIGRHGLVMAHFSHAYPEGCSIYFSFAGRGRLDVYDALWQDALDAVARAGGTVTHHHGVGQLKSRAAARELGPAIRLWHAQKRRWDPDGRMNPGRPLPDVAPPPEEGPPAPAGPGPIFDLDEDSLLATVDPAAAPKELEAALLDRGFVLRIRPDRPLRRWLPSLRRTSLDSWERACFGVQVRFDDGASVWLGPAPRSAAGPDLRTLAMNVATIEAVQVPVRRLDGPDLVVRVEAPALDARDVRPTWRKDDRWGFEQGLADVAACVDGQPARGASPRRPATEARPEGPDAQPDGPVPDTDLPDQHNAGESP